MNKIIYILQILFIFGILSPKNLEWMTLNAQDIVPNYQAFVNDNENIWVGTNNGLYKFNKCTEAWETFNNLNSDLPVNNISCIAIDSLGNFWFGTMGGGLVKYDGIKWSIFNSSNSSNICNDIRTVAVDTKNNIWFGSDQKVLKYDCNNFEIFDEYKDKNIYDWCSIIQLSTDSIGNVWAGFIYGGLFKFNGVEWEYYSNYCYDSNVRTIGVERNGNVLWMGIEGVQGSLIVFRDGKWHPITNDENCCSNISIDESNTVLKIFRHTSEFENYITVTGKKNYKIVCNNTRKAFSTISDGDTIWISTYEGIYKYFEGQFTLYKYPTTKIIDDTIIINDYTLTCYPNPNSEKTTIQINIDFPCNIKLVINDYLGQQVKELYKGFKETGQYSFTFYPELLSPGIYFCTLRAGENVETLKMVIVK
ncbi:MAG: two-component regulator propeller domain-containing protein [bacterium]